MGNISILSLVLFLVIALVVNGNPATSKPAKAPAASGAPAPAVSGPAKDPVAMRSAFACMAKCRGVEIKARAANMAAVATKCQNQCKIQASASTGAPPSGVTPPSASSKAPGALSNYAGQDIDGSDESEATDELPAEGSE